MSPSAFCGHKAAIQHVSIVEFQSPNGYHGRMMPKDMPENMIDRNNNFESRYLALVSGHADLVARFDLNYNLTFVSPSYSRFFGRTKEEMIGTSVLDLVVRDDQRATTLRRFASITPDAPTTRANNMVHRANDTTSHVDWVTTGIFDDDGNLVEYQSIGRDVTQQLLAQEELAKSRMHYMQAARIAGIGYWVWDEIEDRLSYCTEEAAAIYGVSVEYAMERSTTLSGNLSTTHPDDLEEYENALTVAHDNKTGFDVTYRMYRADGKLRYLRQLGEPILDTTGKLIQTVGTVQDITEQKLAEQELLHMARHDALTGIPNRALFLDRLETSLKAAAREKRQIAVLFIDLDGFKAVNDIAGHRGGDQMLVDLAARLHDGLREMDTVGRMGGDEFAVILGGDVTDDHVILVAEKILAAVAEPTDVNGATIHLSASVGIALYPKHGETPGALLEAADNAMYAVKRSCKNGYQFAPSG